MEEATATATAVADWSALPDDVVITVMGSLAVPDLVRSGAVCSTWRDAYATFRRLRLPSPTQSPCLLYSCDAHGPTASALYCPATGESLRVPLPAPLLDGRPVIGASQGWLVTADEVPNLHLVNPLTGAMAALPPITGLHNVESFTSRKGRTRYRVYDCMGYSTESLVYSPAQARDRVYHQVVLSCSPAEGSACVGVALVLHRPDGELSFARLGDERWTPVASPGQACSTSCRNAVYDDGDGLFYALRYDCSVYVIDLRAAASPPATREVNLDNSSKYLVRAPWAGDILQVWRFVDYGGDDDDDDPLCTKHLQIFKVDGDEQKLMEAVVMSPELVSYRR